MMNVVGLAALILALLAIFQLAEAAESDHHQQAHNRILEECKNPDYRSYIKCLKRQKRHHLIGENHEKFAESKACLDCVKTCNATLHSSCQNHCHRHCLHKTKETHQIITQYETDCTGDEPCGGKAKDVQHHPPPNIATNIDVNNVIHNHLNCSSNRTDSNGSDGDEGGTGGSGTSGGKGGDGGTGAGKGTGGSGKDRTNAGGSVNGGSYDGGKLMMPYIQLGLGIGFGPVGGCIFNSPWPCIQQTSKTIDCSQCSNPMFRYKCDISCYPEQQPKNNEVQDNRHLETRSTCKSPHCIGGE